MGAPSGVKEHSKGGGVGAGGGTSLIQPNCHHQRLLLPSHRPVWGVALLASPPGQPGRGPTEGNLWRSPSPQINHGSTFLKGMKAGRFVLAHCLILVCNEESRAGDSRGGVCLPRQKVCVWRWTGHMREGFRVSGAPSPSQRCSWMNTRRGVHGNYQGTL